MNYACKGLTCPLEEYCYRYVNRDSIYQPEFAGIPFNKKKHECKYYVENEKTK